MSKSNTFQSIADDGEDDAGDEEAVQKGVCKHVRRLCCGKYRIYSIGLIVVAMIIAWSILAAFATHNMTEGLLEGLYMTAQIVTTVGYGDLTPEGPGWRALTCVYALAMLIVASAVLNEVNKRVRESANKKLVDRIAKKEGINSYVNKHPGFLGPLSRAALACFCGLAAGTVFFATYEKCTCSYGWSWMGSSFNHTLCPEHDVGITVQQCIDAGGYQKTWMDALYMSLITMTTIGFGDELPMTQLGRAFSIPWMVFGVAGTAWFVGSLSDMLFEDDDQKHIDYNLDKASFDEVDRDGNGVLSRAEYITYVLVKHGILEADTVDMLFKKFDSMDLAGNGVVSWEELCRCRPDYDESSDDEE